MNALRAALVVGAVAATALVPRSTEACSGPAAGVITHVAPKEHTDVPLNARVFVTYSAALGDGEALEDVLLRPVDGEPVAAEVTLHENAGAFTPLQAVLTPGAPLEANTGYEVLSRLGEGGCADCTEGGHVVVATFTTGERKDEEPPTFAGATGATVMGLTASDDGATCGPYKGAYFTLQHPAANDPNLVGYRVYRDDALVSVSGTSGMALCSGMYIGTQGGTFRTSPGTFFVRAYDLAGNEDTNAQGVDVTIDCTQPAQSALDPSTAEPMPPSGCTSVPGPFLVSTLLGAGVALRFGGRRRVRR